MSSKSHALRPGLLAAGLGLVMVVGPPPCPAAEPAPPGSGRLVRVDEEPAPHPDDLLFRDFAPQMLSGFGLFKVAEYETFQAAVAAANQWIREEKIQLVQLETVVLPNIWRSVEEGTADASLNATGNIATWHQFVRVWYRTSEG